MDFQPQYTPPASAAEQFEDSHESLGAPWHALLLSLFLFALSIVVFIGLRFGYKNYLRSEANAVETRVNELAKSVSESDQTQFINFYSQLANIEKVLMRHLFTSNALSFIEQKTIPSVYYTSAKFSTNAEEMELKGFAANNEALVSQLDVFDKSQELRKTILNETDTTKEGIEFSISLGFNSDFFETPK